MNASPPMVREPPPHFRRRVLTGGGLLAAGALGALALLWLRYPYVLPWARTYEFVGPGTISPPTIVSSVDALGRSWQMLTLEPGLHHDDILFLDMPQFVRRDGYVPPTRRVRRYSCDINADGVRGRRTYSREKPSGTYRVAIVGTGVTFGEGVEDDETFSVLLEERLDELRPNGLHFEVMNHGFPCMTTNFAAGRFLHDRERWEVDLWVFIMGVNDALPMFGRSEDAFRSDLEQLHWVVEQTDAEALFAVEPVNSFYPWMQLYPHYRAVLEESIGRTYHLVDLPALLDCQERQDGLRLVTTEELQQVVSYRGGKPRVRFEVEHRATEAEQYIHQDIYNYLDTRPVFMSTFFTDVHLNHLGHRLVAEALTEVIGARVAGRPIPTLDPETCALR